MFAFKRFYIFMDFCFRHQGLKRFAGNLFSFSHHIRGHINTPYAIVFKRFAELAIKIYGVVGIATSVSPASTFGRAFHPA